MKFTKFLFSLILSLFLTAVIGGAVAAHLSVPALPVIGGLTVLGMIPKGLPAGVLPMALDVELWKDWIVEKLFKNNEFLNYARNADGDVIKGKIVHIPQAGSPSGVERNRQKLPATVTRRKDVDVTYALDEFTSDPRLIENAAKILSYDQMNSAMGQDMSYLKQVVAEWMLYHWRPAGTDNLVRTTGSTGVAAHLSGATGNRKELKLDNLEEAAARLDEKNIPEDGRYAMLDARMHKQLTSLLSVSDYRDFSKAYDQAKGVVGELFGFKIMKRSTALRFNNAGTPVAKSPDDAAATTDNAGILCWHEDWVERAIGTMEIFENLRDAQYYGDIYSLLIRAGGRKIDQDGDGVIGIVQAAS